MGIDPKDPLEPVREEIAIEGGRKLWSYTFPAENEVNEDAEEAKTESEPR